MHRLRTPISRGAWKMPHQYNNNNLWVQKNISTYYDHVPTNRSTLNVSLSVHADKHKNKDDFEANSTIIINNIIIVILIIIIIVELILLLILLIIRDHDLTR